MLAEVTATIPGTRHHLGSPERIPPGEGRCFRLGEDEVAVFRTRQDELYAVQAKCPHAAGPLADGLIGDGRVICPLHGHTFELATGASARPTCASLRTYAIRLGNDGEIIVDVPQTPP